MVNTFSKIAILGVPLLFAIFYQYIIKFAAFETLGYWRSVQPLSDFKTVVKCDKVTEPGLEACEDMWFNDATGLLYMACSNSQSKTQWLPALVIHKVISRSQLIVPVPTI